MKVFSSSPEDFAEPGRPKYVDGLIFFAGRASGVGLGLSQLLAVFSALL
ncbi:MAG: hypothetical protein WCD02_14895 [Terriglobales bacterium]